MKKEYLWEVQFPFHGGPEDTEQCKIRHTGEQEGLHFQNCDHVPWGIVIENREALMRDTLAQGKISPAFGAFYNTEYSVFPHIKAIFTDVDGVLTNGGFYYSENGLAMKKFCTRDAAAVHRLRNAGYLVFAVTHSHDDITTLRLRDMNFDKYLIGVEDKIESIKQLCEEYDLIMFRQAVYIDDDVGGLPAMRKVAVSFCPADSPPAVLEQGRVCHAKGGEGVLAEVADLLLRE